MANIDVLQYESLIGTFETIKDHPFKGIDFYKNSFVDVDGDIAQWDEFTTKRQADAKLKSRGAPSSAKDLEDSKGKAANMGYFNESFIASGDDLNNLRQPGSKAKDNAGKAYLAKKLMGLKTMERRTKERLLFSVLTGTLAYTLNDISQSVDMGTAGANKPTAGTTWATASTDIVSDILAWKAIAEEASGRVLTTAWINDTVASYLLKNDTIQNLIGTGALTERIAKTGQIGLFAGIDWIQYDSSYFDGSSTAKFVPDNKVFFTPDPGDWLSYQSGSVTIVEDGDMIVVPSPGIWNVTKDDPVGEKVIVKSCFLPVLTAPDAIIYAGVV